MYFVVRFEVSKSRAVIPANWVLGINEQWEKFINRSMNHNQKFVCFYSERDEIKRDLDFVPDFDNLEFVQFPNEGLYDIKLIFYADTFERADQEMERRRNVKYPNYNICRKTEQPLPLDLAKVRDAAYENANAGVIPAGQASNENNQLIADESQTTRDLAQNQHDDETDRHDGERNVDLSSQNNVFLEDQNGFDFDFATNSNDETNSIDTVDEISTNEGQNDSEAIKPTNNHKASNDLISNPKVGVTDKNKNTFVEENGTNPDQVEMESMNGSGGIDQAEPDENPIEELLMENQISFIENEEAVETYADEPNINLPQTSSTENVDPIKIEAVPVFEPVASNNGELMVLFEDEDVANNSSDNLIEELVDEDITIIIDRKVGIVHPMKTNADDMVKRENDIVSGNVAFNEDNTKRTYMFGKDKFEIPIHIIEKFKDWNTDPDKSKSPQYDKRYINALLLMCVSAENLARQNITDKVKEFMNGFINIRVGNNTDRLCFIEKCIADFCNKKKLELEGGTSQKKHA